MRIKNKQLIVDELKTKLESAPVLYITDISGLNAVQTSNLRRICFTTGVKMQVVKNTLLKRAMNEVDNNYEELYDVLKGNTSLMFSDTGNLPAKLIKDYTKKFKTTKPLLKGAYVESTCYVGENQLDFLFNIKSKDELLGGIISLLQSPAKNVVSALQSGGGKLAGIIKTLSERAE
ncbi:MAG: 50S ribosomal protein L10 [Bacteroidetes bacterium CG2_30_33_31]|nr:MAG: 50S ribosomal protein L10 [Bacteroidetes bacterium CG2_30_33_31]